MQTNENQQCWKENYLCSVSSQEINKVSEQDLGSEQDQDPIKYIVELQFMINMRAWNNGFKIPYFQQCNLLYRLHADAEIEFCCLSFSLS